ncbi:LysR family transcriptional regulator [Marinibacterium sp. SX1]|uniref:LysR family transcriptional regulator n=1 Tax=Marinibacterium sp. SX1 TaxID=3388424 RepID=UPI003D1861D1
MAGPEHLRAMQTFEAVGRLGSVKAAAGELGVSSGAVSQQVRRLEAALGVTLLERRGRGLELTRWGRMYHAELAVGFARLARAGQVLDQLRGQDGLTVCGLPTVAAKWLGRSLWDWARDRPDCPVRLLGSEDLPDLDAGEADFAMWLGPPADDRPGAVLFTDQVVPACAPALLAQPLRAPAELLRLPLLQVAWAARYERFDPPSWAAWAAAHGIADAPHQPGALSFALTASAIDAAVAGQGVVLGQVAMMQDELASGRLVIPFDLRLPLAAPYSLRWSRAALEKPGGLAFRDWLLARGRRQAQALRPGPPDDA